MKDILYILMVLNSYTFMIFFLITAIVEIMCINYPIAVLALVYALINKKNIDINAKDFKIENGLLRPI